MEARASFGRSGISKTFIAAAATLVTLGLALMTTAIAKNASGSTTSVQTHSVKALPAAGPSYAQPGYRPGKQTLDDGLAPGAQSAHGHGAVE